MLELVVEEAFEAAIDVAGQENLDVRLHEMRYAMPPLKVNMSKLHATWTHTAFVLRSTLECAQVATHVQNCMLHGRILSLCCATL